MSCFFCGTKHIPTPEPIQVPRSLTSGAFDEVSACGWRAQAKRVVVTTGKEPALAFDGQSWWRVHAPRVGAVNPIGSGDAFAAGLVWRLLRGEDLGEACRWGSAAGAANALTVLAGEVHRNDVERLVEEVRVEPLNG